MLLLDSAVSILAPHHCLSCGTEGSPCCKKCILNLSVKDSKSECYKCNKPTRLKLGICKTCQDNTPLSGLIWAEDYDLEVVTEMIEELKRRGNLAMASSMAYGLSQNAKLKFLLENWGGQKVLVCHAPTAGSRARMRGWDQARVISKSFAKELKLKNRTLLLRRSRHDQIGASRAQRKLAAEGFFVSLRKLNGEVVLLVDDIVTTGATLEAGAKVLLKSGASEVYGITFARKGLKKPQKKPREA